MGIFLRSLRRRWFRAKALDKGAGEDEDVDRPMFSLVSGTYRQAKRYDDIQGDAASQALVVRDSEGTIVKLPDSAAVEFYTNRVYRGLEQRIGEARVCLSREGQGLQAAMMMTIVQIFSTILECLDDKTQRHFIARQEGWAEAY
ncbi:hypothetical protein BDZ89DRAFT_1111735 [Hymenopellis radicata]|nr:hypothetical protein BDZ89DRAFT_1111735 [Hymenopellis radicata]